MKPAEEIKAEAPPAMTRDDKRIINLKLHEVYINETIGYDADWTDHRVAESLGIPRALVSQVRVVYVEQAFKTLAKSSHPDAGGNADKMAELNAARAEAVSQLTAGGPAR